MKFALVDGIRKKAEPRGAGVCICCGSDVRAYCGNERIFHWKHVAVEKCDNWSEGETEWHRTWKNEFDQNYQECVKFDLLTGEKHIADIYLPGKDLVIEFQHSPIDINEILSREHFYRRMIWVVDIERFVTNVTLFSHFGDVYWEFIELPWAKNQDRLIRQLKQEGKLAEAELLRKDKEGWNYLQDFEKRYSNGDFKKDFFVMTWKYQHKRWNAVQMPLFFDLGDDYLYRSIEPIKVWNGFIVKRYAKQDFLSHYK